MVSITRVSNVTALPEQQLNFVRRNEIRRDINMFWSGVTSLKEESPKSHFHALTRWRGILQTLLHFTFEKPSYQKYHTLDVWAKYMPEVVVNDKWILGEQHFAHKSLYHVDQIQAIRCSGCLILSDNVTVILFSHLVNINLSFRATVYSLSTIYSDENMQYVSYIPHKKDY